MVALLPLLAAAQGGAKSVVTTDRVRAELLAHAPDGIAPGRQVWLGLQLAHKPEWHTYWKNSGDSGLPTQLTWTLPRGVEAGEIAWPVPRKIPIGALANYGYEGTVLLPVPLTITPEFKAPLAGDLEVRLKANWLVCKKECIPEEGDFVLKVPARSTTALNAAQFQQAFDAQPRPLDGGGSTARIEGSALAITVQGLPATLRGKPLEFFPETGEVVETGAQWTQAWKGEAWTAQVPLSPQRAASPTAMPVVLASNGQGWRTELKVVGAWPAAQAAPAGLPPSLEAALRENARAPATPSIGFAAALLGALLGGLILNLMPCVFPILAIKVVGFTRHADDHRGHRISGLAYTAGVVVSFAGLAALMLALRAAGEQLGWGFQLQSPAVVAVLAALFTIIGLNLAGVFEFRSFLPSRWATMQAKHPVADAFLTGVLAVAVASPCTAPFMGASLGLAIALPAAEALAIFAVLGLGMALPYLVASWVPPVARWLPRPGAWMETFRRLMAFPMFGTVVWLVWVLGQQSGIDGAGALLALLVALSMTVWALTLRGRVRLALGALALASFGLLAWTAGGAITRVATAQPAGAQERWQAWAPGRVDQLLAEGRPVFVDFTAAWCVTCQYNKKTTLTDREVLADFESRNFALLRADWTRRDPAITEALAQLGRSGVPVYVVYRQGRPPVVLSEVIGVEEVRSVINNEL
ncbi:protein-disulfide reductase DsbD family protein [Ramlibacter tataouinensis]|uniref:Protein-disulfide reductase n=1 Tax=Ramlibacter tataouinensis TaxID=94132 RepID=A0A127JZV9_9BURK|nr:thioredoxin family protein [Ramlibacter tataouinensis]AMO25403.1 protein-disulfide reductase [Ramlibacter tataouinensis]